MTVGIQQPDTRPMRPRMTIPRVALPEAVPEVITLPAAFTELLARLKRLAGDVTATRRALLDAEASRRGAEQTDRRAYAAALAESSSAQPNGTALKAVEQQISELTERVAALKLARGAAEEELVGWLAAHRTQYEAALAAPTDAARKTLAKAHRQLDAAEANLGELLAFGGWLRDPMRRPKFPARVEA